MFLFTLTLLSACAAEKPSMPGLDDVVDRTVLLSNALASDDLRRAKAEVPQLMQAIQGIAEGSTASEQVTQLKVDASALQNAEDMATLREALHTFTDTTLEVLSQVQLPGDEPLSVVYCPMAFDYTGAHWLQRIEGVRNPYFGAEMLACGVVKTTVEPGKILKRNTLKP